jgi:hypothetical protein
MQLSPATPTARKLIVSYGLMLATRLLLDTCKAVRLN